MKRSDKEYRLIDRLPLSRINLALYVLVLVVAIIIVYFVVAQYLMYARQLPKQDLEFNITKNSVESFGGAFHPIIVVETAARKKSYIDVKLQSPEYSTQQSSGQHVNNYTALFILPANTFSHEFQLSVTATDKNGIVKTKQIALYTQPLPEVVFKVS